MFKKSIVLLSAVFCFNIFAAESQEFLKVAEISTDIFYVQPSSFMMGDLDKKDENIAVMNIKILDKKKKTSIFAKAYLEFESCENKEGKLFITKLDATPLYEEDFILQGGTVGSTLAESICFGYNYFKEKRQAKK